MDSNANYSKSKSRPESRRWTVFSCTVHRSLLCTCVFRRYENTPHRRRVPTRKKKKKKKVAHNSYILGYNQPSLQPSRQPLILLYSYNVWQSRECPLHITQKKRFTPHTITTDVTSLQKLPNILGQLNNSRTANLCSFCLCVTQTCFICLLGNTIVNSAKIQNWA